MDREKSVTRNPAHPHPLPNPHHRKIELQSPLDLVYLQSNIAASARQKLDLHFPPHASQPSTNSATSANQQDRSPENQETAVQQSELADPMRTRVQELVALFLEKTWEGAKHSISINGLDATSIHPPRPSPSSSGPPSLSNRPPPSDDVLTTVKEEQEGIDFEYEAYDPRLSSKLASLYGDLEALTTQVSQLRRTAPRKAAEEYQRSLLGAMEEDQRLYEDMARRRPALLPTEPVLRLNDVDERWASHVAEMYERGTRELGRLGGGGDRETDEHGSGPHRNGGGGGSLTETMGRVQRAKIVAEEFE